MIIGNKKELFTTEMRKKVIEIAEAGIERVRADFLMNYSVKYDKDSQILSIDDTLYDVSKKRIFVVGFGKVAGKMAKALEKILDPKNIEAGVVISKEGKYDLQKIEVVEAGHPVPDGRSVEGAKRTLSLKEKHSLKGNDLILCLISGGGSSLMTSPQKGVTLDDQKKTTELLLRSGAKINEVNVIRKHLSEVKGGNLAKFFHPTKIISIVISDVVGNDLSTIASGPTFPDSSTFSESLEILSKYDLLNKVPKGVILHLRKGEDGKIPETPKDLENSDHFIIGDSERVLLEMEGKAKELNLEPLIVTASETGSAKKAAKRRAEEIIKGIYNKNTLLLAGETTPKLPKTHGKGGRCEHYGAVSMVSLSGYNKEWVLLAMATDGVDFIPDAAGVIVDENSLKKAKEKELDVENYIENFDTFHLFEKLGNSLIKTGDTGTNVGDIMVYIICRKNSD